MNTQPAYTRDEVIEEVSKWTVGLGIVTVALFPLSVPILVLTAVALVPLLVPVVAIGLVAAVIALPVLLARRLVRAMRKRRAPKGPPLTPEPVLGAPRPAYPPSTRR